MQTTIVLTPRQQIIRKVWLAFWCLVLVSQAVAPVAWLLSTALKSNQEALISIPPQWIPQQPTLENFQAVWNKIPFLAFGLNSFIVAFISTTLNITSALVMGYCLGRYNFVGKPWLNALVLASMFVPFQVTMIPLYLLCLQLGLSEANGIIPLYIALALPFCVSGFGIIYVKNAVASLPIALEESAILEGASFVQLIWHVVMPALKPVLMTAVIFSFLAQWGEFLWPSVLINSPEHMTIPLGLVQLQSQFSMNWRWVAAGTIISLIPSFVFFALMQKALLNPDSVGGVKE